MAMPLYNEQGHIEGQISNEELYILIVENTVEDMKKREARLRRQIQQQMQEHRTLLIDIQSVEQKIEIARKEYLSKVGD